MRKIILLLGSLLAIELTSCPSPLHLSDNADIRILTIDNGTLEPIFDVSIIQYRSSVEHAVDTILVYAEPDDPNADLYINPAQPCRLNVGENVIIATITAPNGLVKTYSVIVTRAIAPTQGSLMVTFDSLGATEEASPTSIVVEGLRATVGELPAPPSKVGYSFGGWYTEVDGGGTQFTSDTIVTTDITVYAYWICYPFYTVSFDSDGGTAIEPFLVALPATTVGALPSPPTKAGYAFDGWYTATQGTGTVFTADTTITADITVYAKWLGHSYTIHFDSQGATVSAKPSEINVSSPDTIIRALPTAPERAGYIFYGWYTGQNGMGAQLEAGSIITTDFTVYAKWGVGYEVTFDSQGGSPIESQVVAPGTLLQQPRHPSKSGYGFGGWYNDSAITHAWDFAADIVSTNCVLYAKWYPASEGLIYTLINGETEYSITAGTARSGDIVIPDYWLNKRVTAIGDRAFDKCTSLTSLVIPSTISAIGAKAFYNCANLIHLTIPDGVFSINEETFAFSGLRSLTLPESITSIGAYALWGCEDLVEFEIPSKVVSIGRKAFGGCGSLTKLEIPSGVSTIEDGLFANCQRLTSVTIPEGVTIIGLDAFSACNRLVTLILPNSLTIIESGAFMGCSGLSSLTIPGNVSQIGSHAFNECIKLTSIIIPHGVTVIESSAFANCFGLSSVTIPDSVKTIGTLAFDSCNSLMNLSIPESVTTINSMAFKGCSSLTSLTLPSGITSIEYETFGWCSELKTMTIPEGVTKIGSQAFASCKNLELITLPNSIALIDYYAFVGCTGLRKIELSRDSPPALGTNPFSNVTGCVLHIPVSSSGYDIAPWIDKSIFSSIVADL